MSNAPKGANAQAMPIDRRAALGSLAGAGALLTVSRLAHAASADVLSLLIAEHERARDAFHHAISEEDAAEFDRDAGFVGPFGRVYSLREDGPFGYVISIREDKDRIAKWIGDLIGRQADVLTTVAKVAPDAAATVLIAIKREREAALARLNEVFAKEEAAAKRREQAGDVEMAALLAVCAHRCSSLEEIERKFRYLGSFQDELLDEPWQEAIFRSFIRDEQVV